jgi:small subunit ribosomal protein YMR-31
LKFPHSILIAAPHTPAPHPAAPPEVAEHFQEFLSKLQSTSTSAASPSSNPKGQSLGSSAKGEVKPSKSSESSGPVDYERFYDAPSYLWKTKPLSEAEMEAVMVSSGIALHDETNPQPLNLSEPARRAAEHPTSAKYASCT